MSRNHRHSIQRQQLVFTSQRLSTARTVEAEAREWFRADMEPVLEKVFDEWAEEEGLYCIDRLEIDLGTLDRETFSQAVTERLTTALRDWKNREHRTGPQNLDRPDSPEWRKFLATGELPEGRYTEADRQWAALIFYLTHGRFPWPRQMQVQHPETTFFTTLSAERRAAMKVLLTQRPAVLRLIAWLPEEALAELIGSYAPDTPGHDQILETKRKLSQAFSEWPTLLPALIRLYWHSLFSEITSLPLSAEMIRSIVGTDALIASESRKKLAKTLIKMIRNSPPPNRIWTASLERLAQAWGGKDILSSGLQMKGRMDTSHSSGTRPGEDNQTNMPPSAEPLVMGSPVESSINESVPQSFEQNSVLYVDNGGLVLLHPFFTTLFTDRQWWSRAGWRSEADQERAVYLLAYLASGKKNNPEFDCTLPKLLAGWPLDQPLSLPSEPREEDCVAAEELLTAAIRHWGALGNTSGDSLREGFLLRNARLQPKDGGYRLTVERKTMDILLNKLPWGIGLIRMPWMDQMLSVEWT